MRNNIFSSDIAIDMGSCYTRIIVAGSGLTLYEPTVLVRDTKTDEVVAVGNDAREMEGKTPDCLKVIKPVSGGVISDFDNAVELLKAFILKACDKNIIKPRAVITVPNPITEVEKRAILEAANIAGTRSTFILESTIAAASGANCDVSLARGMLVVHIGGGRTDISAVSVGQSVISHTIKSAGNVFTEATIKYIKNKYDLNVGWVSAEKLKEEIGCVYSLDITQSRKIYGSDATTGMPRFIIISSEELREAYEDEVAPIIDAVRMALEDTPPELLADIVEDGILLTGGGASLYGLDRRIRMELGIKVFLASDLAMCAVMGAGKELEKIRINPIRQNQAPNESA